MKTWMKRALTLIVAGIACIYVQQFCRSKTDGFAMYKIQSQLPFDPQFETHSISSSELQDVKKILSQPFNYLGKGAQCYAFVSEDGQHVLKFFRLYHLRVPHWFEKIPLPSFLDHYRQNKVKKKYGEFFRDFLSYKIACDHLKEETGLLYVHLNKTSHLKQKVTLYDKIRVKHEVELDNMEFLVQKKADLFYEAMEKMILNKEIEQAKGSLSQLVCYLAKRSQMGFYDKDPDINTNFGIHKGQTLQIDVGRFRPDPSRISSAVFINDIKRVTDNLKQWLEIRNKDLATFLEEEILNLDHHFSSEHQQAI